VNEDTEAALKDALALAEELELCTLLVGAWARDLCLPPKSRQPPRLTNDADLALAVAGWPEIERFFESAEKGAFRGASLSELLMYHRATGVKVDVVPCGGIEEPQGKLRNPDSGRVLNTIGLREAFDSALNRPVGDRSVLVPRPSGFVLLKLLAFSDRDALRDLRDLGHVARLGHEDDDASFFEDDVALELLSAGTLTLGDMPVWQLGRDLRARFSEEALESFAQALKKLTMRSEGVRGELFSDLKDPDERIERSDQTIRVLGLSTTYG
tara:strand:+ start:210 stop:1016 length:807 start_codon:yes stop_codon:yes gene_type:complete